MRSRHRPRPEEASGPFPAPVDTLIEWLFPVSGDLPSLDVEGTTITQRKVASDAPGEQIVTCVEDEDIDLVVVATHGPPGTDPIRVDCVAERGIRRSPVPVFTAKPGQTSLGPEGAERAIRS